MNPHVTHDTICAFADERVNLRREKVTKYREQVGRLSDRLKERINEDPDYGFVKTLHSGSLRKGTALSTLNDIDLAVYVKAGEAPTIEAQLLAWMADRLEDALTPLGLKRDQITPEDHCVRIDYRGSGLRVDVVPVLYEGEADDVGYLITKDSGDRVKTSVRLHLDFIRKRKDLQPEDFAQVVRLCKWWVKQCKRKDEAFRFKSFMVELVCAHLADQGLDMSDYVRALQRVMAYIVKTQLQERIIFTDNYSASAVGQATGDEIQIYDPVNAENNVAKRYTRAERLAIVEAAQEALNAMTEAAYVETKGRSVDLWRTLLGPGFNG